MNYDGRGRPVKYELRDLGNCKVMVDLYPYHDGIRLPKVIGVFCKCGSPMHKEVEPSHVGGGFTTVYVWKCPLSRWWNFWKHTTSLVDDFRLL